MANLQQKKLENLYASQVIPACFADLNLDELRQQNEKLPSKLKKCTASMAMKPRSTSTQ
jgi:hypothetical protein